MDNLNNLKTNIKLFEYYKLLGEKSIEQISDENLFWQYNPECNSVSTIVKHLSGNMLSRWTNFLATDGEKESRNREEEFTSNIDSREEMMGLWNRGWSCFFETLKSLQPSDLNKIIFIRNQGQTVMEAINRQLAHYPYHIGQIVFIAKMVCNDPWISLSIPKGQSKKYNDNKFEQPKQTEHFTDEFLNKKAE